MAIITRYEASKQYGMSQMALKRFQDRNPRPECFVDIKDYPHPKIDDQASSWKLYLIKYNARMNKTKHSSEVKQDSDTVDKLLSIMDDVITEKYGEKEALKLKFAIIDRMD